MSHVPTLLNTLIMGYLHTPILEHVKFRYVEIHTCKLLILKIMKLSDKQIAVAKELGKHPYAR
jgi:hypothetical protein